MLEKHSRKTYILILQHFTPELEDKLKGVYTYKDIKKSQDVFDLVKLVPSVCHLKDNNKHEIMGEVKIDNQLYLIYQSLYDSNLDYLYALKDHLKLSETQNGAVGYRPGLSSS